MDLREQIDEAAKRVGGPVALARRVGCSRAALLKAQRRGTYPTRGEFVGRMREEVERALRTPALPKPKPKAKVKAKAAPAAAVPAQTPAQESRAERLAEAAAVRQMGEARMIQLKVNAEAERQAVARRDLIPADVFLGMTADVGGEQRRMVDRMKRRVDADPEHAAEHIEEEWIATAPTIHAMLRRCEPSASGTGDAP